MCVCLCVCDVQLLKNADSHFMVGSGHRVTVTGRENKEDYDLTIAGLYLTYC